VDCRRQSHTMIVILAWKTALAPAPSSIPRLDASSLCTHANTAQSHTRHIHTHTHALSTYLPMFLAGHLAQVHFLFAVARGGGHRNRGRRAVSYCRCGWRGRGCVSTMLACSQRTHTHTHTHTHTLRLSSLPAPTLVHLPSGGLDLPTS